MNVRHVNDKLLERKVILIGYGKSQFRIGYRYKLYRIHNNPLNPLIADIYEENMDTRTFEILCCGHIEHKKWQREHWQSFMKERGILPMMDEYYM